MYNKRIADIYGLSAENTAAMVQKQTREIAKVYSASLNKVRNEIALFWAKYGGEDLTLYEATKYNRLARLEKAIQNELKKLYAQNFNLTKTTIKDAFLDNYYVTGYAIETTLNKGIGFGALNKSAIDAAILNPYDAITWPERSKKAINALNDAVRQEVTAGIVQGKGYAAVAKEVKDKFGKGYSGAKRIIWTESHRAMSAGRVAGFDKAESAANKLGVKTSRMWVSSLDAKTRDAHQAADGQKAKDGKFDVGGEILEGPGLGTIPGNNINCRCTTIMQIDKFPQKYRRAGNEKIPYQTYKEWADKKDIKIKSDIKPRKKYKVTDVNQDLARKFKEKNK